jgi:hypothetical protein
MSQRVLIVLLLSATLIAACGGTSDYEKRGNETRAMSYLKKFQTAATIYQVEFGHYGSLAELHDNRGLESALYRAWDGLDDPQPLSGYLYAYFEKDAERVGLCAYPSEPGENGDLMICTLADPRNFQAEEIADGAFVSHGEEWNFYTTDFTSYGGALRRWPSVRELETGFTRIKKHSPKEGLAEARQLVDGLQAR